MENKFEPLAYELIVDGTWRIIVRRHIDTGLMLAECETLPGLYIHAHSEGELISKTPGMVREFAALVSIASAAPGEAKVFGPEDYGPGQAWRPAPEK